MGCGQGSGAAASTPGAIRVDGALGEQRTWTVDQLATLPLQTQDVTFLAEGNSKSLHAQGVSLLDLLQRAKPKFNSKMKRDAIHYAVLIHAVDKYQAVVSWGEIDPDFGAKPVLVDDPVYLHFARHIAQHPLDPYGFILLWYSAPQPAMEVLCPPVLPYWLALGTRLEVTEDLDLSGLDPDDPDTAPYAVYWWLGVLEERLIDVLSAR